MADRPEEDIYKCVNIANWVGNWRSSLFEDPGNEIILDEVASAIDELIAEDCVPPDMVSEFQDLSSRVRFVGDTANPEETASDLAILDIPTAIEKAAGVESELTG